MVNSIMKIKKNRQNDLKFVWGNVDISFTANQLIRHHLLIRVLLHLKYLSFFDSVIIVTINNT